MKFYWYTFLFASFVFGYNTNINWSNKINRIAIFQGQPLEVRKIAKTYFEINHNVGFPQYSKFSSFLLVSQTSRIPRQDSTTKDVVVEPTGGRFISIAKLCRIFSKGNKKIS